MKELPERKQNRLKEYDYSAPGAYFVTICTNKRKNLLQLECDNVGNALRGVPECKQNKIIHKWIKETENKFCIKIDKYAVLPNHIHLIVIISERHAGRSLQDIIRWFKTMTTNEYIDGVKNGELIPFEKKLWQKSFYDHIIRNEYDYKEIWEYIDKNYLKWLEIKTYNENIENTLRGVQK